jgi:hypothetical protein
MKSNFLKLVLPAFAILLAVGLAFATEAPSVDGVGYYKPSNQPWQSIPVGDECFQGGEDACMHLGYQLYDEPSISGTPLRKPL